MSLTIAVATVLAVLNSAPAPIDVQQECEDHIAAMRTVQGAEVVYDCELGEWLEFESWARMGD